MSVHSRNTRIWYGAYLIESLDVAGLPAGKTSLARIWGLS